jgi:hypothetical protein
MMFTIQSSTIYHRTEKRMLKTHISITNNTDTKLRPSNPKHTNQDQMKKWYKQNKMKFELYQSLVAHLLAPILHLKYIEDTIKTTTSSKAQNFCKQQSWLFHYKIYKFRRMTMHKQVKWLIVKYLSRAINSSNDFGITHLENGRAGFTMKKKFKVKCIEYKKINWER